jgi:hypothetical protein
MDIERDVMRCRIDRSREGKKIWFSILGKDNLLCFFNMFSSFQPSLGAIHEDLGTYLILYATHKTFTEEGIN